MEFPSKTSSHKSASSFINHNSINNNQGKTPSQEKNAILEKQTSFVDLPQFFLNEFIKYTVNTWDVQDPPQEKDDDEEAYNITIKRESRKPNISQIKGLQKSISLLKHRKSNFRKSKRESKPVLTAISEEIKITESNIVAAASGAIILGTPKDYVRIDFKNGNVYEGYAKMKLMDGKGRFWWSSGAYYEGDFKNGEITGKGILFYPNNSYYSGEFCNGYQHGFGTFFVSLTEIYYIGYWKFGKKHGKGILSFGDNCYYDGEWFEDYKHGVGVRKYPDGSTYNGGWKRNYQHGEGIIHYCNNDFYNGEWLEGKPHGYGEYTWNAQSVKGLAFSIDNIYKGDWSDGKRNGYGIIYFGMEGSQLAQEFRENLKDGAGIFICGDGSCFEKNPLFENDFLVQNVTSTYPNSREGNTKLSFFSEMNKNTFKSTTSLKNKSEKRLSLEFSKHNDLVVDESEFGDVTNMIDEVFPHIDPKCDPIAIPVHSTGLQINISYYIEMLEKDYNCWISKIPRKETSTPSCVIKKTTPPGINPELEERNLRNKLQFNRDLLQNLYNKYASLTIREPLRKPLMSRLFLWQMYKDLKIYDKNISLVGTDLILLDYSNNFLNTDHYPFEPIYYWQFLHSLLGVIYKCYASLEYFENHKTKGVYAGMLEDFIHEHVKPNANNTSGQVLNKFLDLLPFTSTYSLYENYGEPLSARCFLKNCCVKKDESPACYLKPFPNPEELGIQHGINMVCPGSRILYIPEEANDIGKTSRQYPKFPFIRDEFFTNLKMFRVLGAKKIIECLIKICPLIEKNNSVVNIDYPMVFLEFYEVLILCAQELIKKLKSDETSKFSKMKVVDKKESSGVHNEAVLKFKKRGNKRK